MTHRTTTSGRFERLKSTLGTAPTSEVSSKIDSPSIWAAEALGFQPSPIQARILDHPGDRLIICCARQWGKSTIIAIKALYEAVHNPNTVTIVLSRSKEQAGIIIERIRANAASLGHKLKRHKGRTHSVQLPNGSAIFAIPHNAETAVGYTADTLIIDEAVAVKDDTFAAILPCIARTNGKLWVLSTPTVQTGTFYTIWHDQTLSRWTRVKATVDDIESADKDLIALQMRLYPEKAKQDFYCEFVQPAGRLVSRELFDNCIRPTRVEKDQQCR